MMSSFKDWMDSRSVAFEHESNLKPKLDFLIFFLYSKKLQLEKSIKKQIRRAFELEKKSELQLHWIDCQYSMDSVTVVTEKIVISQQEEFQPIIYKATTISFTPSRDTHFR